MDSFGAGVKQTRARLFNSVINEYQQLDAQGNFTYTVSTDEYRLRFDSQYGGGNYPEDFAPVFRFETYNETIEINESKSIEIEFPIVTMTVKVQDQNGSPIENVTISTNRVFQYGFNSEGTDFYGYTEYPSYVGKKTNSQGEVILHLLPGTNPYTFIATPGENSGYSVSNAVTTCLLYTSPSPRDA